jgi:hypothetical protein
MTSTRLIRLAIFSVVALFTASSSIAGTRAACRFVGPGLSPSAPPGILLSMQGDKVRVDIQVQPWNASLLYDGSTGVLTVLDHVFRTFDDYGKTKRMMLRGTLGVALRVNDMRLKNGGPELDVKLRDQMAAAIKTVFNTSFQKTASGRKVGDWTADLYEGKNGNAVLSAGTVPSAKAMSDAKDWAIWKEFLQVVLETGRGGLEYYGADPKNLAVWPGFQGFPVSLSWREGSKVVYRFQVVTLENKTFDGAIFAPPMEYKAQSLLEMMKVQ